MRQRVTALFLLLVLILVLVGLAGCQRAAETKKTAYPEKPIEFVVPFSPGGGSDVMARTIAKIMEQEKILPQPLVVVNKPGGGGAIGWTYVAEKKGDPYVIATVSSSFWTTPLTENTPVNYRSFTPIAGIGLDDFLLLVKADSPIKDVKQVVEMAKAKPKSLKMGGTSTSDDRVVTSLLEKKAGIQFNYIPFKGGGDVMTALLGGHVDLAWANPGEALSQIEAKKIRPIASASQNRLSKFPDVPTLKEMGFDVVFQQRRGIVAPLGIPEEAVKVLEAAFKKLTETTTWKKDYLEKNLITPDFMGSKDFAKALEDRNETYKSVYKDLGIIK